MLNKKAGSPGLRVDTSPMLEAGLRQDRKIVGPLIITWPEGALVHLSSPSAGGLADPSP